MYLKPGQGLSDSTDICHDIKTDLCHLSWKYRNMMWEKEKDNKTIRTFL